MQHADASFTFLHRLEEIEWNVRDRRWQSALALALTVPDVCGGIAFPELVRRYRDGRVMTDRSGQPSRDVGAQYIRWFDTFAAPFFKVRQGDAAAYIGGQRCWQLRCEYLHQNRGFDNELPGEEVRFHLGVNCGTSVCRGPEEQSDEDVRIDIREFCLRMCRAGRSYYDSAGADFSLYHTPVLDFVRTRTARPHAAVAVVCRQEAYGRAVAAALAEVTDRVEVFTHPEDARQRLPRPNLWVVDGALLEQSNQPWRADKTTPVVLLAPQGAAELGKDRVRRLPPLFLPEQLRQAALALLQ